MVMKKKTGAMLCPNCNRLISVSAKACIHCGWKNYGVSGLSTGFEKAIKSFGGLVPVLMAVCIFFYIVSLLLDLSNLLNPQGLFGFLAPGGAALYRLGMTGVYPMSQGKWWTLITAIYLHGGLLHILFNMIWLRNTGYAVEELFGTSRAFLIFTLSGIIGFLASNLLGVMFTIGASGSVFGLLGALIYYGRRRGGSFGEAIFRQVGSWALMAFVFGFLIPGINNWAHAGGFLGGYLAAWLLGFQEKQRETNVHRHLAVFTALLTLVAFLLALFY